MIVGVPIESYPGELRVSIVPAAIPNLSKMGLEVLVEQQAGEKAGFTDTAYMEHGARILNNRNELFSSSNFLLNVHGLSTDSNSRHPNLDLLHSGHVVIGLLNPWRNSEVTRELATKNVTSFALELLPRISRAQSMDVLSSMATLSGYKGVLLGAVALKKIFPLMMTAAGTLTPAKVFVIGAGVAGLQAIATSKRLGATVQAYDVRPAVKEQVESLGAKFVELALETQESESSGGYAREKGEEFYRLQRELMSQAIAESDLVITTAAVPGKKAPILITRDMVQNMHPGSVIVDLAAEGGGNCELTRPGETIEANGVSILGPINIPSTVAFHASQMYSKNVLAFLQNLMKNGNLDLNMEDQIIKDTLITHRGEIVNSQVRELVVSPGST